MNESRTKATNAEPGSQTLFQIVKNAYQLIPGTSLKPHVKKSGVGM